MFFNTLITREFHAYSILRVDLHCNYNYRVISCIRVILKNNKKSFFARSGLREMAENHHFAVRVSNK